ncbi:MAG TPA: sulfatase, partial [Verrucomicrobiae bacterium]
MDPIRENQLLVNRRHFFGRMATGIGTAALGSVLNPHLFAAVGEQKRYGGLAGVPHFTPKAKRVIY